MFKPVNIYLVCLLACLPMEMSGQILSKDERLKFLALGDSYTIGESVAELQRWPVQLVAALTRKGYSCSPPEIIAVTGWRTDELKKAIDARNPMPDYSLVSLLIGVNNQYQAKSLSDYEREFEGLLRRAIDLAGGRKSNVFVLSIPDYGFTPFGKDRREEISRGIDQFNAVNRKIAEQHDILYINITDISRRGLTEPDLVAEDGLHPSGKMYALWVERILQKL